MAALTESLPSACIFLEKYELLVLEQEPVEFLNEIIIIEIYFPRPQRRSPGLAPRAGDE